MSQEFDGPTLDQVLLYLRNTQWAIRHDLRLDRLEDPAKWEFYVEHLDDLQLAISQWPRKPSP